MNLEKLLPPATQARLKRARFGGARGAVGSLVGNYQSAFKGSGLTFSELREYSPGDEVRSIDWKSSARSSRTYVRSYEEERQLRILVALDVSASISDSISALARKRSIEFCALLGYLSRQSQDAFGLCMFADSIKLMLPPNSTKTHWQHIAKELTLQAEGSNSVNSATSIPAMLEGIKKHCKTRTCLFIVSDFFAPPFEKELRQLSSKSYVTCVHISPELNSWLPKAGLVQIRDAETGSTQLVDSSSSHVRDSLSTALETQREQIKQMTLQSRANYLPITQTADGPFFQFLKRRSIR